MTQGNRPWESDKGATLIMLASALVFLMGIAAMAVDLAALRFDRRADRLASDAAVTAGAIAIDPLAGSDAAAACQIAWEYLLLNLEDEGGSISPPACSTVFAGSCGNPLVAREATASAGPYTIEITHPVPDGHELMAGQAIDPDIDGGSCQRLGVSVQRTREYAFARVMGFDTGSTYVRSVARIAVKPGEGELVPLLVLEPISCDALLTSGQGKVTVSYFMDTPGYIVVDSDGSKTSNPNRCGNNIWTIDSTGTQNGWIRAIDVPPPDSIPAAILSYALSGAPGANPIRSYDPSDTTSPVDPGDISDPTEPAYTWFRLYPTPIGTTRRITRAPIDWRYNCKSSYPDYPLDLSNPGVGIPVDPCPNTPAPLIDQHVAAYGEPVGNPPMGFQRWTQLLDGTPRYPCTVDGTTWPLPSIDESGDWWVDCPGGLIVNGKTVTLSDGNVVLDGNIDLRSDGQLHVNPSPSSDHFVFVREGDLIKGAQSTIALTQTFVYLDNGRIDLVGGGTGGVFWTAPLAGNFEDLALWAEAPLIYQIGGQAVNTLVGTFFTPFGNPFTLTGQGGQFQTDAQFITRRLEVKGLGEVRMHPDPERSTKIPIRGVMLIR